MNVKRLLDLSGKISVVTGGTGFYCKPISEGLAEAGAHVVIASRNRQRCRDWALELEGRGLSASGDGFDRETSPPSWSSASECGRSSAPSTCWSTTRWHVHESVRRPAGSLGAIHGGQRHRCLRHFPGIRGPDDGTGQGAVVNIGSIQSVVAPDFTNYAGTDMTTPPDYHFHKHGMVGLTKYLAAWAGPRGVRVNAIAPGGLALGGETEPFLSQYCSNTFLGRMAQYDDIKGSVVFLASEASAYVTGHTILLDGGYCA